jgi:ABC-type uncharacterized transport system auxiliary subunit
MNAIRCSGPMLAAALLAGCLSTGAPPPAVRWFDPTPPAPAGGGSAGSPLRLQRVTAAPHLDRRFAVRVGPREFTFDDLHRWTAEPALLVQAAVEQELFGSGAFARSEDRESPVLEVHVVAFELDLTGQPSARVERRAGLAGGAAHSYGARAAAAGRDPAALCAAMAAALGNVAPELAGALAR